MIFNSMLVPHLCPYCEPFMPLSLRTQGLVQKVIKHWWSILLQWFKLASII